MAKISPSILSLEFFCKNSIYLRVRLRERFVIPQLLKQLAVYKIKERLKYMAKISPSILSLDFFYKNSIYLRVRLRERFVNPQLLKQLAVYKSKERLK